MSSSRKHSPALSPTREIPKTQAQVRRLPLSAFVSDPKDATGIARAYLEHRYTQQEVANHLGVHYSTISRRLRASCVPRARNMLRDYKT
jgi:hypothetical protein